MMGNHYLRNLRAAVGSSAGPYGYTLAVWTTGAVIMDTHGKPTAPYAAAFMAGAVLAFALVGALAFGKPTGNFAREQGQEVIWGSTHVFSVGLSIGAAFVVGNYVTGFIVWPLAAFLSTAIYLLVLGGESTFAYLLAAGHEEQD